MRKSTALDSAQRSAWRNPFGIALIAYYLLMAIVGLCIPDDILTANAWARDFSDFMASMVPQIDRITALNIKPDVNRFYFSVLWAGSPFILLLMFSSIFKKRAALHKLWDAELSKILLSLLFFALTVAWAQYLWAVDPSMRLSKLLFQSDLGRAFYAQIVLSIGPLFSLTGLILWLIGWLTGHIPHPQHKGQHLD